MTELTATERDALLSVCERWEVPHAVLDAMDVDMYSAVAAIVTAHTDELRCQLAATRIQLHAAREALAACRECAAKRAGR